LRLKFIDAGRENVKKYQPQAIAQQYIDLYREMEANLQKGN
jgi:hypothetical protein